MASDDRTILFTEREVMKMQKTKATGNMDAILLDRETLYTYVNAGRRTAERIAEQAGAVRKFGRIVRYYRPAIDAYLAKTEKS